MAQIMLRIFAAVFTLAAICVMATSSQSFILLGFTVKAHYSHSSAINIIVCAASVLSVIFVYHFSRSGSNLRSAFHLFLHYMVTMALGISGCAGAMAMRYISRYGEQKMGWMAMCNRLRNFCNQMMISMVLSYLAFFFLFGISNKVIKPKNEVPKQ